MSDTKKWSGSILDQLDPDWAYRETGLWNGMTRQETDAWLEARKRELAQLKLLERFTPTTPPN